MNGLRAGERDDVGADGLPLYFSDRPAPRPRPPDRRGRRWPPAHQLAARRQPDRPGLVPGPSGASAPLGTARSTEITFRRAVEVPFGCCLEALMEWWAAAGHDGVLDVGHSQLSGMPAPGEVDRAYHLEARLGRGLLGRPVRADLELFAWLGSFGTQLTLCPRRVVHPGRHYFATGHALLDAIVVVLQRHGAGARP